ncbi:MAG: hypothetical protein ACM3NQ_24985 [Bacteroidales bacterium]
MNTNLHVMGQRLGGSSSERRSGGRTQISVPGRIIWRDSKGTPRFSTVVTRDVSESGASIACLSGPPIPLHRLVHLQLDRSMRGFDSLPAALRDGRVLAAVYRVGAVSRVTGLPDAYALRLLVEPVQSAVSMPAPYALPA